jgi:hypothetical protein
MMGSKKMLPPFMKKGAAKPAKAGMKAKKYAKGGGIEVKGKTRGRVC